MGGQKSGKESPHIPRRGLETPGARARRLGKALIDSGHPPGEKLSAYVTLVVIIVAAVAANFWQPWATQKGSAPPSDASKAHSLEQLKQSELPGREPAPVLVSHSPRIYVFEDFMSKAECEVLMKLVDGRLEPAKVVSSTENKYNTQTQTRNNEQIWLSQHEEKTHPVLRHVLKRMHRVARGPDTDAEALQIGRYVTGTKYEGHIDSDPQHDVARPMTLIVYLKDVEEGGNTMFPLTEKSNCSSKWHTNAAGEKKFGCAYCCELPMQGSIRVKPKQGRAVLFFSHKMDGTQDRLSEHIACPSHSGEKWIAQRWFRWVQYQNIKYEGDPRFDGHAEKHFPEVLKRNGPWDGNVRVISRKAPRIYVMENFLSAEECTYLRKLGGTPLLEPIPKEDANDPERKKISLEMEVEDSILARIAKRLNRAAYAPDDHAEPMQVEAYGAGSDKGLTLDYWESESSSDDQSAKNYRPLTIQIFLNDMEGEGGETIFPKGQCKSPQECCKSRKGLRIKPQQGRAVLFYNEVAEGKGIDSKAAHAVCPHTKSKLWMLQRWYRSKPFSSIQHKVDPEYDRTHMIAAQVI
eukprot:gnl/MRDRNA2_/MRDRNA2_75528_c0_seq1.p1 gnl/MRDRNA2_/MRDRNA2_75528_c0~~gnl/MRDRNA2_/MRDRNA2_75528_c0_seq1.p1  ORF type:complete len:577 (-),score=101.18 gnl/MRDRNA2_/MRDRNA2_75528_c0_seq1:35-1765(-)